jgi:hypothetical protein
MQLVKAGVKGRLKLKRKFLSNTNISTKAGIVTPSIVTASIMIVIVTFDLLTTRQLLPYNTTSETIM